MARAGQKVAKALLGAGLSARHDVSRRCRQLTLHRMLHMHTHRLLALGAHVLSHKVFAQSNQTKQVSWMGHCHRRGFQNIGRKTDACLFRACVRPRSGAHVARSRESVTQSVAPPPTLASPGDARAIRARYQPERLLDALSCSAGLISTNLEMPKRFTALTSFTSQSYFSTCFS
jgi:hypothetical protein